MIDKKELQVKLQYPFCGFCFVLENIESGLKEKKTWKPPLYELIYYEQRLNVHRDEDIPYIETMGFKKEKIALFVDREKLFRKGLEIIRTTTKINRIELNGVIREIKILNDKIFNI